MEDSIGVFSCGHCGNISKMNVLNKTYHDQSYDIPDYEGYTVNSGTTSYILECPTCKKVNIASSFWHENMDEDDVQTYDIIYPKNSDDPLGLPEKILKAYKAAEKVKPIDVNAYAILMRRLLELICLENGANDGTLTGMLQELANKNEIPQKLVKVATGLKDFGNVGAHAGSGDLSEKEIPIVNALCTAILEYIYSAPYLATLAENNLNRIKTQAKPNTKN